MKKSWDNSDWNSPLCSQRCSFIKDLSIFCIFNWKMKWSSILGENGIFLLSNFLQSFSTKILIIIFGLPIRIGQKLVKLHHSAVWYTLQIFPFNPFRTGEGGIFSHTVHAHLHTCTIKTWQYWFLNIRFLIFSKSISKMIISCK